LPVSGPVRLQFFPTFRCNRSCSFCFNREIGYHGRELDASGVRSLLSAAAENNILELDILGGEPTLFEHLRLLIAEAVSRGIVVNLSTNGTNVGTLSELASAFPREQLRIGVSLNEEPISPQLLEFIVSEKPLLKSVCRRSRTVPPFVHDLLQQSGIDFYLIFMDAFNGEDLRESLPFPEYRRRLEDLQKSRANVHGVSCSGFLPESDADSAPGIRCPAGTTKVSAMPDGTLFPCYLLFRYPEYRLGNILNSDIAALSSNPHLLLFRSFFQNPCEAETCGYHGDCRGGCPAINRIITGDADGGDIRCRTKPIRSINPAPATNTVG